MARAYLTAVPSLVRFRKHLRKGTLKGKRAFWKRERRAAKRIEQPAS